MQQPVSQSSKRMSQAKGFAYGLSSPKTPRCSGQGGLATRRRHIDDVRRSHHQINEQSSLTQASRLAEHLELEEVFLEARFICSYAMLWYGPGEESEGLLGLATVLTFCIIRQGLGAYFLCNSTLT